MKTGLAPLLAVLLVGCSSAITEQTVQADFERMMVSDYPGCRVEQVTDVAFGDGWDDGLEVAVVFVGSCEAAHDPAASPHDSFDGAARMALSYRKTARGDWEMFHRSRPVPKPDRE